MSELAVREEVLVLNSRETNGLTVELLYQKLGETVLVHLVDDREGAEMKFPVPADRALDAFEHPYAYAPLHEAA
jgi:hypothetical protein